MRDSVNLQRRHGHLPGRDDRPRFVIGYSSRPRWSGMSRLGSIVPVLRHPPMLWLNFGSSVLSAIAMLVAPAIPPGTVLPVALSSTLDAKQDRPGQKIEGRLMQDIPLAPGEKIKAGAHVIGHIVEVTRPNGRGSRMVLKFDQLEAGGKKIPLTVSARAIAAMESVYAAEVPINPLSDGESTNEWVMRQVGGDIVNRRLGLVGSGDGVVGKWMGGAAWAKLVYVSGCPPHDVPNDEQAMWVFSVGACGLYGFRDVELVSAGDGTPAGQIVLESHQDLRVGGGSGWFLIVSAAPPATK